MLVSRTQTPTGNGPLKGFELPASWRTVGDNPLGEKEQAFAVSQLASCRGGSIASYLPWLLGEVRGQRVLDIGAVQHTLEFTNSPAWVHQHLATAARHLVGVDIVEDALDSITRRGYDVRNVDATSGVDLGERFDVVVIGDVIEHVDSPVGLLLFAKRHLEPGGRIVIKTPNPYYFRHVLAAYRTPEIVANLEHVAWLSPWMALEVSYRAKLKLAAYHPVVGRPRGWRAMARRFIQGLVGSDSWSAWDYVYMMQLEDG